jgi:endonuclease III
LVSNSESNLSLKTKESNSNQEKDKLAANSKKQLKVTMGAPYLEAMSLLIKDGLYESQAEIIKDALRRLFNHYELSCISDACIVEPPQP